MKGKRYRKKRCSGVKSMNNTANVEKQIQDTLLPLFIGNMAVNTFGGCGCYIYLPMLCSFTFFFYLLHCQESLNWD